VEGQTQHSDWWQFERQPHRVKNFRNFSNNAQEFKSDHWRQFPQDIDRMSEQLGVNTYRFSLDWARINPKKGVFDEQALERYAQLAKQMRDRGIRPLVTLFHWSSPQWIWDQQNPEKSGWYHPDVVTYFTDYVHKAVKALTPHVDFFCTLNEPNIFLYGSYSEGILCPGHKREDIDLLPVLKNLLHAHVSARRIIKEANPDSEVGIAHNYYMFEPRDNWNPLNRLVAALTEFGFTWSMADAFVTGKMVFTTRQREVFVEEIDGLKDSLDFMGVNFYERALVQMRKPWQTREPHILHGHHEDKEVWPTEIHTQGFERVLQTVHERYKLPIYITENGQATPNDQERQTFMRHHLAILAQAIDKGIDIRGYFWWSLLDNQEWAGGFLPRLGLYEVDYHSGDRQLRGTGAAYAEIIKNQGFTWKHANP